MSVIECDVPRHSALGEDLIERADFRDAYRVPLNRDLGVVDIFFTIFARRPTWMNVMLISRNKLVALAGLEVPTHGRNNEHGKERPLLCRPQDWTMANLFS